ncbi:hypothetical protein RchiOBHm_Chr3g0494281 [Rosa chinensis]|uniref:Uncharacterized protein n=1 Tax=Rosa chinensis TaxID=74649 RepID=A0A2P6RGX6_ROSCH|nr:hypothetical protein RchiOBHm_Chr3g0494281 [Rosa chinensis]
MLLIDYIEDNAIFKCGGRDLYFYFESYILKNTKKNRKKCQKKKKFVAFIY